MLGQSRIAIHDGDIGASTNKRQDNLTPQYACPTRHHHASTGKVVVLLDLFLIHPTFPPFQAFNSQQSAVSKDKKQVGKSASLHIDAS
jgi:hypothetical protein